MSISHRSGRRRLLPLVAALALTATLLLVPSGAVQAVTQGIAGTITVAGDVLLDEAHVAVYPMDPNVYVDETDTIGQDGEFAISLPPGQYWLRFSGRNTEVGPLAHEWWNDSPTKAASTTVTVAPGAVTTTDVELSLGGSITGHVAQDTGLSETLATIYMIDAGFPSGYAKVTSTVTNEETGNYTFRGLPTGDYKVHFYLRRSEYEGWWHNASTPETATIVPVNAPESVLDISPVDLNPLGTISGTVTSATTGEPLADVGIGVYSEYYPGDSEYYPGDYSALDISAQTAADGTYTLGAPAGTYRVGFSTSGMKKEFWNNARTPQGGQDVTVTTGEATQNIDVALEAAATVQINITPPVIAGVRRIGSTLTTTEGEWEVLPGMLMALRWLRNGVAIPGASGVSYTPTTADAGKQLVVEATAHKSGLAPVKAFSAPAMIPYLTLKLTSPAALTGKLRVGKILRAVAPRSTPAATVKYQWLRNGIAIRGATKASYKLVKKDRGKKVGVRITLTKPGYSTVVKVIRKTRNTR